jgi:uncharacterized protein YbjT (DUF2867 family)
MRPPSITLKGNIMYLLLGSNGNITSKAARILLSQGKKVRVVGRNAKNLEGLRQAGAELAIGAVADAEFLAEAMRGAEAAYTMIPPNYASPDVLAEQDRLGTAIAKAIVASGVKRVVNLSSIGAHLPRGTGPIAGLHAQEQRLNKIAGVDLLHLRPGYFFENHLEAIGLIKAYGVYTDMIDSDVSIPSIGSGDIAVVVARELRKPSSQADKHILHLHGPRAYTQTEAAAILGKAIGNPGLKHVKAAMVQHGMSQNMADLYEEMSNALSQPEFMTEALAGPTEVTPTSLEQFAAIFKEAYEAAGG